MGHVFRRLLPCVLALTIYGTRAEGAPPPPPPAVTYLAVNGGGYGLSGYPSGHDGSIATTATGDAILLPDGTTLSAGYSLEIPNGAGLALFRTAAPPALSDAGARLDAVGFEGVGNPLYYEGTPLAPAGGVTLDVEHTFYRQLTTGVPQDTDQNRTDFLLVSPVADTLPGARLGSPGPENTTSPVNRTGTAGLTEGLIDTGNGMTATTRPNRERNACGSVPSAPCGGPTRFGEMIIRRKFTNHSASPITRLRFRVVDLTTYPAPDGAADLRVLTSATIMVDSSSDGLVTVQGTVLEGPPEQAQAGRRMERDALSRRRWRQPRASARARRHDLSAVAPGRAANGHVQVLRPRRGVALT
jgi:hypothetical protein